MKKIPYVPVKAWVVDRAENDNILQHTGGKRENGYMRLIDGLKMRQVAGQTILFPVGKAVARVSQAAVLNSEAAEMVKMMTEDFTVDIIVQKALKIFKAEENVLRKDIEKLVNTLERAGMLEGEEFTKRLLSEKKIISGTAIMVNGQIVSNKITNGDDMTLLKKLNKVNKKE